MPPRARQTKPRPPAPSITGSCRWALQPTAEHPGVLVINDTAYLVTELLDGLARLGFRLQKTDGTVYDIDATQAFWTCDCPDFQFRRTNDPKGCKHLAGLRAALKALGVIE